MNIPLYILGFLSRYGALHGYKLKQFIAKQVSDFANIKLPTIYYHLNKMKSKGYVTVQVEKIGKWPEREVYEITESGKDFFISLLKKNLFASFKFEFNLDSVLFYSQYLEKNEIVNAFNKYQQYLEETIMHIKTHKKEQMKNIPDLMKKIADKIFEHHLVHYKTELEWLKDTKDIINKVM